VVNTILKKSEGFFLVIFIALLWSTLVIEFLIFYYHAAPLEQVSEITKKSK